MISSLRKPLMPCSMPYILSICPSCSAASIAPTRLALITAVAPPDWPIIRLPCVCDDKKCLLSSLFSLSLYQLAGAASRGGVMMAVGCVVCGCIYMNLVLLLFIKPYSYGIMASFRLLACCLMACLPYESDNLLESR